VKKGAEDVFVGNRKGYWEIYLSNVPENVEKEFEFQTIPVSYHTVVYQLQGEAQDHYEEVPQGSSLSKTVLEQNQKIPRILPIPIFAKNKNQVMKTTWAVTLSRNDKMYGLTVHHLFQYPSKNFVSTDNVVYGSSSDVIGSLSFWDAAKDAATFQYFKDVQNLQQFYIGKDGNLTGRDASFCGCGGNHVTGTVVIVGTDRICIIFNSNAHTIASDSGGVWKYNGESFAMHQAISVWGPDNDICSHSISVQAMQKWMDSELKIA